MYRVKLYVMTTRWNVLMIMLLAGTLSIIYVYNGGKLQESQPFSKTINTKPIRVVDVQLPKILQKWVNSGLASISFNSNLLSSTYEEYNTTNVLKNRLNLMSKACDTNYTFLKVNGRKPVFFRSKSTNISCCKVPKAGSSFWGAVIMAIESTNRSQNVFNINRNAIHGHNEINIHSVSKFDTKVLVTRDPYTRLFSVFIDKYFLLGSLGRSLMKAVGAGPYQHDGNTCGYSITFNQFLDDVTETALAGEEMNEHLVPVSDLCDVCGIKYDMLSRQESLNRDMLYLLDKVNLTETKRAAIKTATSPKGIEQTIHSLIASYLSDYTTYQKDCPSRVLHMEKVWATLQIQGHVSKDALFPKRFFQTFSDYKTSTITSVIIQIMTSRPMTLEEKTRQREMYVRHAYEEVGDETIRKVQTVFMKDFLLFGYNIAPPHQRLT